MDSGNEYVIQVKGNCKLLLKSIKEYCTNHKATKTYKAKAHCRGRIENRNIRVFTSSSSAITSIIPVGWHGIKTIIHAKYSGYRNNKRYEKDHYYISSLSNIKDCQLATCIRSHWQIENNLHWVKDAVMYEDKSRIKGHDLAAILSIIRKSVLNIYRTNQHYSITHAIEKYTNRIQECLKLIDHSYSNQHLVK